MIKKPKTNWTNNVKISIFKRTYSWHFPDPKVDNSVGKIQHSICSALKCIECNLGMFLWNSSQPFIVHYVLKWFKKFTIWIECTTNDVYNSTIFFLLTSEVSPKSMVTIWLLLSTTEKNYKIFCFSKWQSINILI